MNDDVVIYSAEDCPKCTTVKKYVEAYNINATVKVLGVDYTQDDFQQLMPGIREIPQVYINGERLGGLEQFKRHLIKMM